jgi:hypothetical protein
VDPGEDGLIGGEHACVRRISAPQVAHHHPTGGERVPDGPQEGPGGEGVRDLVVGEGVEDDQVVPARRRLLDEPTPVPSVDDHVRVRLESEVGSRHLYNDRVDLDHVDPGFGEQLAHVHGHRATPEPDEEDAGVRRNEREPEHADPCVGELKVAGMSGIERALAGPTLTGHEDAKSVSALQDPDPAKLGLGFEDHTGDPLGNEVHGCRQCHRYEHEDGPEGRSGWVSGTSISRCHVLMNVSTGGRVAPSRGAGHSMSRLTPGGQPRGPGRKGRMVGATPRTGTNTRGLPGLSSQPWPA